MEIKQHGSQRGTSLSMCKVSIWKVPQSPDMSRRLKKGSECQSHVWLTALPVFLHLFLTLVQRNAQLKALDNRESTPNYRETKHLKTMVVEKISQHKPNNYQTFRRRKWKTKEIRLMGRYLARPSQNFTIPWDSIQSGNSPGVTKWPTCKHKDTSNVKTHVRN